LFDERLHHGFHRCLTAVAMDFEAILGHAAGDQLLASPPVLCGVPAAKGNPA
jgi:hypothetical protein